MPYIGRQPQVGNYVKLDDISSQFDGSQTSFSLTINNETYIPQKPEQLIISLSGVIQEPIAAYTISGGNIVFASAPAGLDTFFGIGLGDVLDIGVPSDNTVSKRKLNTTYQESKAVYSDLRGLDTSLFSNGDTVSISGRSNPGDGAGGDFRWNSSDLSTEVSNDEVTTSEGDGGTYVAPISDKSGSSGAWVRFQRASPEFEWYGIAADGTTNDDNVITAFENTYTNEEVNLHGQTILVSSIPTKNKYVNGFFRINNFEFDANIDFPVYDTLDAYVLQIDNGDRYHAWTQDSCWYYNGVLGMQWNGGEAHDSADQHVIIGTSWDKGKSVGRLEWGYKGFANTSGRRMAFAGNCIDGQEMYIVREGSASEHVLYGRRRAEVYTDTIQVDSISSGRLQFFIDTHGVKPGDRLTVNFWGGANVGGVDLNNLALTVNSSFDTTFITDSVGASSGDSEVAKIELFYEQDAFERMLVDGTDIGSAVVAASGDHSSQPVLFHAMAAQQFGGGQTGSFFTGIHGGGATGPYIVWVENPLQQDTIPGNTSNIRNVLKINSTLNEGVEPSVTENPSNGHIMGFIRSQDGNPSTGYPVRFWWSNDRLATDATVVDAPWGNTFSAKSSIPCRIVNGELHFCLIGDRFSEGDVPLYWGRVPVPTTASEASNIFNNIKLIFLKNLYRADIDQSGGSGVPSMAVIDDNTLSFIVSSETPPLRPSYNGQPHIEAITVKIGDEDQYFYKYDPNLLMPTYTSQAETLEVNTVKSASTFARSAVIQANGTVNFSNGLSISKTGTGQYDVTFVDKNGNPELLPTADSYIPFLTIFDDSDNYGNLGSPRSSGGFTVYTKQPDGSTNGGIFDDSGFTLGIVEIWDWSRSDWT